MQDETDPGDARSDMDPWPEVAQDPDTAEDTATSDVDKEAWSGVGQPTADPPTDSAVADESSAPHGDVSPSTEPTQSVSMPSPDDAYALAETLDLLRTSVRELIARDRRTTAAAVSLEMRKRSNNTFSLANAGFTKFRDLLYFAEQVGAVTLQPPSPGGDVEVFPASAATDSSATVSPQQPRTVRRDLWQAFVDWSPKWQRAFDTQTNKVITILANSGEGGESTGSILWKKDPVRYRRVVPLTLDDQLQWIRAFVGQLEPGEERELLSATLDHQRPIAAFVAAINDLPEYQKAWRQTLSRNVTARITEWVLEQQLTIDIYHQPAQKRPTSAALPEMTSRPRQTPGYQGNPSDELRRQVLEAVARMPLSELLRLPIPVEYLLRQ